jgi:hypothetical protein
MKFVIGIVFLLMPVSDAMTYGKIFPTRFPLNTVSGTQRLIVKNVSEISEFSELVHEEDDTRRILELREGIAIAKEKEMPRFTFRCICGTKYSDVFSAE